MRAARCSAAPVWDLPNLLALKKRKENLITWLNVLQEFASLCVYDAEEKQTFSHSNMSVKRMLKDEGL